MPHDARHRLKSRCRQVHWIWRLGALDGQIHERHEFSPVSRQLMRGESPPRDIADARQGCGFVLVISMPPGKHSLTPHTFQMTWTIITITEVREQSTASYDSVYSR